MYILTVLFGTFILIRVIVVLRVGPVGLSALFKLLICLLDTIFDKFVPEAGKCHCRIFSICIFSTILRLMNLIPWRRGSLEPSPRGPFDLSALFRFVSLLDFFGFPIWIRATYWDLGGGCWIGRIFEKYSKVRFFFLRTKIPNKIRTRVLRRTEA